MTAITNRVSFDGRNGGQVDGELAEPAGSGKVGGVVLVQEWWGVNDHIRSLVTKMAGEGFVVVAPDLYHGKTTKDPGEAATLMNALDTKQAVEEIAGAVAFLKQHPRCNGKVAVMGFCMGGALSFASACGISGLAAVSPFYGIPPAEKVDYAKVTAPILTHVAKKDQWVTPAKALDVQKTIKEKSGAEITVEQYDADHAFVNDTRPEVYSPDDAKLAWDRTTKFFKEHLA